MHLLPICLATAAYLLALLTGSVGKRRLPTLKNGHSHLLLMKNAKLSFMSGNTARHRADNLNLMALLKLLVILLTLCHPPLSNAAVEEGSEETEDNNDFSMMGTLAKQGLHNIDNEQWNAYGQATYISNAQDAFHAAYSNLNGTPNSLSPYAQRSFTATVTGYFALRAWKGAEFYAVPEMISELPLSGLHGLGGGIQNFELQKNGTESATWYLSRAFYRQTIGLGGNLIHVNSGAMQLGGNMTSRRLVITAGNFSILDIFDKNSYAGDLRNQFLNMAFMTNAAYDFAADARGYTWGLVGEFYYDQWAFRFARIMGPIDPNQLMLNLDLLNAYGDQIELERKHTLYGQPGALKLLGYRNQERMGSWTDAIAALQSNPNNNATTCTTFSYGSGNAGAPDLCWARKSNVKMGIGVNMEQAVSEDLGLFFRGMVSDGKTEVYSYTSSDSSLSIGGLLKGSRWGREKDTTGIGYAASFLSSQHIAYLNLGGIDGFIGDGKINYKPEQVLDIFYKYHFIKSTWLSLDYQHIANPAYNADRGPVDIYSGRVHFEF